MKKLFLAVLPILALGLAACGGDGDPSSSEGDPSNSSGGSTTSIVSESSQPGGDSSSSQPTPPTDYTFNVAWGEWANDSAKFGIYAYTEGSPSTETKKELVAGTSITFPQASTHFILVRFNSEASEFNWDLKWNQTANIPVSDIQADKTFTFSAWGGDDKISTFIWA